MGDLEFLARALCRAEGVQEEALDDCGRLAWVARRTLARALLAELRGWRDGQMAELLDGEAVIAPIDVEDDEEPMGWREWLLALGLIDEATAEGVLDLTREEE